MTCLFHSFKDWKLYSNQHSLPLTAVVLEYEETQKGNRRDTIQNGLSKAWQTMKNAVETGLTETMKSRSGMIDGGGKKVYNHGTSVLSLSFQHLIARTLAAKEVNACMGRVVAAPTAGASGIMPGILYTLQKIHNIPDEKIEDALLLSAGIALIIEHKASVAGSVGGCQVETGSAAAMGAGAIVYCLGGDVNQIFNAVAITLQCMLGLICDPVAGLVEIPCVVRNASAAAIANSSAQIAISQVDSVIPVDEVVDAMGEIGASMKERYKETAQGGLAITPTARSIAKKVLVSDIDIMDEKKIL